ncbi:MAG TPA: dihydrolipoamide acetyltransferase family protein [Bacteroidales bacterium]|mgnify:CR=1 FL=1|nr:dihydrolipoamide acetyltransferase family protein [Bacteroidales bacterium]
MATPVIMPKQGQSVETCVIMTWFKNKGDYVKTGDILCSYETDKASFELESPAEGSLLEIFFPEGAEVPVLTNIAVIGREGEDIEAFRPGSAGASAPAETSKKETLEQATAESTVSSLSVTETGGKIRISPRARNLALAKGVPITQIKGTGPNGRIIVRDIENALKGYTPLEATKEPEPALSGTETEYTDKPLSNVRRIIAGAMHASLQNSAQLTHHMSADVRKLLEARKKIKEERASGKSVPDITLNDMVCFCVIKALRKFPEANSHFLGDYIRIFNSVHLGLAVDTERRLMVPAIKNACRMTLPVLSKELKSAAEACRKGNINPELIQSTAASFTVTNLGAYGVEMFTPVINLPQVAILGVCTITYRPADISNGVMGFIPVIGLSLTYDHRAIDGGPATLFLKEIKEQIEGFNFNEHIT